MRIVKLLRSLGLNDDAATVYTSLLDCGPASISKISRDSGLHRPNVYKAIPVLKAKGLITSVPRGKRTRYAAESPVQLKGLIDSLNDSFETVLPELLQTYQHRQGRPIIKVLQGDKAVEMIMRDIVESQKKGDVYYRYSSRRESSMTHLPKDYRDIRDKKQLQRFVITGAKKARGYKPRLNKEVKVIPKEYGDFDYDVALIIYANKMGYIDYNTQTVLIVENELMAAFQMKIFQLLYDRL
jgi:sugar-specific transcriptional regulator TrmB